MRRDGHLTIQRLEPRVAEVTGSNLRHDPGRSKTDDRVVPVLEDPRLLGMDAEPTGDLERRFAGALSAYASAPQADFVRHARDDARAGYAGASIDLTPPQDAGELVSRHDAHAEPCGKDLLRAESK